MIGNWAYTLLLLIGWPLWNAYRERGLQKEFDNNPKFEPPETNQLKWDLRHIREDISLLCHLMMIVALLLIILILK